jgi:hypothetical protein
MRRNFDLSTVLVGIGAIAVLVSLFLDWYAPGLRAWDVFEIADWALFALAAGALVVLAAETTTAAPPGQRLGWICGIVALIVIAELLDPPPAAHGAGRELGAWVALGGGALMVAGAVMAMSQISVTIGVAQRERRTRTAAVDARAADEAAAARSGASESGGASGSASELWQSPAPREAATGDEAMPRRRGRTRTGRDEPGSTRSGAGRSAAGDEGATSRSGAGDEPGSGRSGASGAGGGAGPIGPDPDRTQPLSPVERPDAEG